MKSGFGADEIDRRLVDLRFYINHFLFGIFGAVKLLSISQPASKPGKKEAGRSASVCGNICTVINVAVLAADGAFFNGNFLIATVNQTPHIKA
jgi:hypothetical protein